MNILSNPNLVSKIGSIIQDILPQNNTPINENLNISPDGYFITKVEKNKLDNLIIQSNYPGDDDEKRNFQIKASDFIRNNHLY